MIQDGSKAVKDISTRRLFAPYFKARWQNMQNIACDNAIYELVKEPYLSYYIAYIKQWLQWSSGFVPMLHRGDFFSTGIGYTVCEIFERECMNGGYRFESTGAFKEFLQNWNITNSFEDVLGTIFFHQNAGGNAIACLTPIDGDLYPSALPINRVRFSINRRGIITNALILNRFSAGSKSYFSKEVRMFMDGKPYYRVQLVENGGTVLAPSWGGSPINHIPEEIQEQWRNNYGDITPGEWYCIPKIKTLGLYNIKNKAVAVAVADLPGYSDSTLHTALDILYSIDYNYTQQQLDQYWGRTRVLIPKNITTRNIGTGVVNEHGITRNVSAGIIDDSGKGTPTVMVSSGVTFTESIHAPLDDDYYAEVPNPASVDGKPFQPTFIQPDLRGDPRKLIRDSDLELLASKVGLSSSTLANHLSYNHSKTATEVFSEQDTTEVTVNKKRALAAIAVNAMLRDLSDFYGFSESAHIEFNRGGVNSTSENRALLEDYNAGTMPLKQYLLRRHRSLTEEEADKWIKDIENEQKKKREFEIGGMPFNNRDYFGDGQDFIERSREPPVIEQ